MAQATKDVLLLAVPETAGSALYGMLDVLASTGNIWQTLVRTDVLPALFNPRVLALHKKPFACGNNIPIRADVTIKEDPSADILILPELWLGPDEHLKNKYPTIMDFIRRKHAEGTYIYSACSGAVMLAESQPVFCRCSRACCHSWWQNFVARSRSAYHRAPRKSWRGAPNHQGISTQMARRGAIALRIFGKKHAPC